MSYVPRIKVSGHAGAYHLITRTNGKEYRLNDEMKEYFIEMLRRLSRVFYISLIAWSILDNHYHLLALFRDADEIDPEEAMKRWNDYHAGSVYVRNAALESHRKYVVKEMTDVSSFMKRLNYHMTKKYNWMKGVEGTLWERRFRSSVIERGYATITCAAYIELNAFRASLVKAPEMYRYSSIKYLASGNEGELIDRELLDEGLGTGGKSIEEVVKTYTAYIYEAGIVPHEGKEGGIVVTEEMRAQIAKYDLKVTKGSLSRRIEALIRGKVTGCFEYAQCIYDEYISLDYAGKSARRHAERWIRGAMNNLWTVCYAKERGSQ